MFQIEMMTRKKGLYEKYFKRLLDILLSGLALVVLSPLMLAVALLVKMKLGSPVIFKQERPGKNEKIFSMYKFRTMTDERNKNGQLLPDSVRLTPFGKLLRSTSLDELPELWNIFKGDMSIIGPRPQLVRDMVFMSKEQRQRHQLRVGLTGLAQVNGRNNLTWEEKLDWDLKYMNKITFLLDLKIIFKTVGKVLKRSDVVREGTVSDLDFGDYLLLTGRISKIEYDKKLLEARRLMGYER